MRRVNARGFAAEFEQFAALAQHGPIEVLRGGKRVGVFLSPEDTTACNVWTTPTGRHELGRRSSATTSFRPRRRCAG